MNDLRLRRMAFAAPAAAVGALLLLELPAGRALDGRIVIPAAIAVAILFATALGARPLNAGAGLMWSLGLAFMLWILGGIGAGTTADAVGARFPLLAGLVVASVPLGLAAGVAGMRPRARPRIARAVCAGGFAGIFGGWAFGKWMEQAGFFPLVAGLVRSESAAVGVALHFCIAVIIGATFGLLFARDIRGLGSSLGWGVAYGVLWWFAGALTLLPLLSGRAPDWSAAHAAALFGSLVGHIVYGAIVGVLYAAFDGTWTWLFERSDPLNREVEGSGHAALSSLGRGALASIIGALLFSLVMVATGSLPTVARIAGGTSAGFGFVVHLVIGALIGASFGVLFRDEAADDRGAIAWGALYGLLWWFLGPLTLFPILLGGRFAWTIGAATAQLPSLFGHLVYGMALALVFCELERRHRAELFVDDRLQRRWERRRRPAGTAAPAVWLFFIGTSVTLTIVLGNA